jgi:hypothetical protein
MGTSEGTATSESTGTTEGTTARRSEALGWLVGRLAWEKGLRFEEPAAPAAVPAPRTPKTRSPKPAA